MQRLKLIAGIAVAIAAVLLGYDNFGGAGQTGSKQPQDDPTVVTGGRTGVSATSPASSATAPDFRAAADQILDAFEAGRGDLWIEAGGVVQRVLSDDSEGSRHQRFIVRLPNDHTVLIAHNIDLAQRVPVKAGDGVSFYGEYEWNERGGVVHWTHHDPRNRRAGGWIEHKGTTYR